MGTRSFFGRLDPRHEQSILPLHTGPKRSPSEHQLSTLSPKPDDDVLSVEGEIPKAWMEEPDDEPSTPPGLWATSSRDTAGMTMSASNMKSRPLFAGPPPPIAASMVVMRDPIRVDPTAGRSVRYRNTPHTLLGASPTDANSLLLKHRRIEVEQISDTVWRGFASQEKALEREVQVLLDQQAVALVAGTGIESGASSTGSSTPTGPFYSAKGYKERATLSLYIPPRVTRDGNVVPTRQLENDQPPGLKTTRQNLGKLMASIASLKHDESAYIEDALNKRINALQQMDLLRLKRVTLEEELRSLTENSEEPLAREFKVLDSEHYALGEEIQLLEAKLSRMRNRHRLLKERMEDIKNRRDAGLSGYYGALSELNAEARKFAQHPRFQPLDPDLLRIGSEVEGVPDTTGGAEFMRLIPKRRTMKMANSWWKAEVEVLKRCKERLDQHRQALEEGGQVWDKVTQLVSNFESELQQALKTGTISTSSAKGKEKAPSDEDIISDQLLHMESVIEDLQGFMQQSEDNNWNLLICAIGAELAAFEDGYNVLKAMVDTPKDATPGTSTDAELAGPSAQRGITHLADEESDNEVPPDLFAGPTPDGPAEDNEDSATLRRYDSENEVPPEFLVEHV
ncbi:hypothetical protein ACQKWADRAFT_97219 [Trichoderma austrokoningii]